MPLTPGPGLGEGDKQRRDACLLLFPRYGAIAQFASNHDFYHLYLLKAGRTIYECFWMMTQTSVSCKPSVAGTKNNPEWEPPTHSGA